MKVFITGATGVLGRRLVKKLSSAGHAVTGLVRNEAGKKTMRSLGGVAAHGDHFDADGLAKAAEGCEVVIHAATSIPTGVRYSPQDWAMNDRLRREGTQALVSCAAKIGARLYLQQSIVWVARPPDYSFFDETTTPHPEGVYASALDAEVIAQEGGQKSGFGVAVLRCGMFYSADAAHTKMMRDGIRRRKIPVIGKGDAIWAIVHADDAADAFLEAAKSERSGLWHVVDDQPVTLNEFFYEFAEVLHAPTPRSLPVWLSKIVVGQATTRYLTSSTRTNNTKFKSDFGWMPRFPNYKEGLKQIAEEWNKE